MSTPAPWYVTELDGKHRAYCRGKMRSSDIFGEWEGKNLRQQEATT